MNIKSVFQDITNVSEKNIKLVIKKTGHRKRLLRWLFEVVLDFKYSHITYARAIYIIDRFTLINGIDFSKYQLLGIASLFISAKLEEKVVQTIKEHVIVTDHSFNRNEILLMERKILETLDYQLFFLLPHYYVGEAELASLNIDLNIRDKKYLFYSAISYILELGDTNGNIFNIFMKSKNTLLDTIKNGISKKDLLFYVNSKNGISFFNSIKNQSKN